MSSDFENISEKSGMIALLLALFVPIPGIHSFYSGRWKRGLAQLFTFNFIGIGWICDVIKICTGKFKDSEGKFIKF